MNNSAKGALTVLMVIFTVIIVVTMIHCKVEQDRQTRKLLDDLLQNTIDASKFELEQGAVIRGYGEYVKENGKMVFKWKEGLK